MMKEVISSIQMSVHFNIKVNIRSECYTLNTIGAVLSHILHSCQKNLINNK